MGVMSGWLGHGSGTCVMEGTLPEIRDNWVSEVLTKQFSGIQLLRGGKTLTELKYIL